MTATEKLRHSLQTAEGEKAWVEWFANPTTQLVLDVAREQARPKPVAVDSDALASVRAHERSVGANELVDMLMDPVAFRAPDRQNPLNQLRPDYGAEEILKRGIE